MTYKQPPFKFLDLFEEKDLDKDKKLKLMNQMRTNPLKEKSEIVSYLKNGQIVMFCPDIVFNVLTDDDEEYIGNSSVYTDGVYLWRDYLIGYFEKYNLFLPSEFIYHAKQNLWVSPTITFEKEREILLEVFGVE
jgi:hypothetical protein